MPGPPQDDSYNPDKSNESTVAAWEIQVRGQNQDLPRRIHLCSYPDMNHWTAIGPARAADIAGDALKLLNIPDDLLSTSRTMLQVLSLDYLLVTRPTKT